MERFRRRLEGRTAIVFLDYDGTLTPIVSRPELARISPEMTRRVGALAERCTVAIVSGRSRATLKEFLGLENVIYAGSHGLDIEGPAGSGIRLDVGKELMDSLAIVHRKLSASLAGIPGVLVELSGYTVPVHYRLVDSEQIPLVDEIVERELRDHPKIRMNRGKMVFEIRPNISWNKGEAVLWIREKLGLNAENSVAFYLGDDTTDEDAFAVLGKQDIGILVDSCPRKTAARYSLKDPSEVGPFLQGLLDIINPPASEKQNLTLDLDDAYSQPNQRRGGAPCRPTE